MNITKEKLLSAGGACKGDLALINRYAVKELSADEVFIFSVVLCDNDIDRDFERFDIGALNTLAKLFVGKTGIFDHSPKAQNQVARIFACEVVRLEGETTKAGEPCCALKARAYIPRTEKNRDLIAELEAGIKKEVSVGCAVGKITCSVCGADLLHARCPHRKGEQSPEGGVCHSILSEPTDAYEWSFVALPAQPRAGVTKGFGGKGENSMDKIIKNAKNSVALSASEAQRLADYAESLERDAEAGKAYRAELEKRCVSAIFESKPSADLETAKAIAKKLSCAELGGLIKLFEPESEPCAPQLFCAESVKAKDDKAFSI